MDDPRARTGPCSLGSCAACGRRLSDHALDSVACIGWGPEFLCAVCDDWRMEVVRRFLSKTRRFTHRTLRFMEHERLGLRLFG